MKLEAYQLQNMLADNAKTVVTRTLIALGLQQPFMSYRQAYKLYGEKVVTRWIEQGRVRRGERLSRVELEEANFSMTWLPYLNDE